MLICGLGLGPSMPLYTLAIQNAVPLPLIGQATSAGQFFRQIGGAIGAAVMGTLLTASLAQSLPTGDAARSAAVVGEGISTEAMAAGGPALGNVRSEDTPAPQVQAQTRTAFAEAITRNYFYTLFIVAAAWLVTCLVPQLPLRKTNAPAPVLVE
jgi:hypothetical protein